MSPKTVFGALAALAMSFVWQAPASAAPAVQSKTWIINGLASAVPFIGYGLNRLTKQIPDSKYYSYLSPLEGSAVVQTEVMADIRKTYRANPNVEINLIGMSFGANLASYMVSQLNKEGIPVSYLGIVDGLPLGTITPNVRRVDNFYCTLPGCLRDKIRLTRGNNLTITNSFPFRTTHIALGDEDDMHQRILHQIATYSLDVADPSLDFAYTASTE